MSARIVIDTSVYIEVLRDRSFADAFRSHYERMVPRAHLSSVVAQELLAGVRSKAHRRLALALIEPFERVRRVVTPTHRIWCDAGEVLSELWRDAASFRSAVHAGLINDVLIALTARAMGGAVVTRNRRHFEMIGAVRKVGVQVV